MKRSDKGKTGPRSIAPHDQADEFRRLAYEHADQKRFAKAAQALERAALLEPGHAETWNDLGVIYERCLRYADARRCFEKCLQLKPGYPAAMNNMAKTAKDQGLVEEAIGWYRKAIESEPGYAVAHSNLLITLHYREEIDPNDMLAEHVAWARQHAPAALTCKKHENRLNEDRPLRIGYLTPDLRSHSVAYFLEGILQAHDRSMYELWAYAEVHQPDATTERLKSQFRTYRQTVGLSDEQVARMIRQDGIDVLIDLAGHSADNRLLVMARRPAPLQVTYLGYPDTTGMNVVDYRLTDVWADPQGAEEYYTERLIRLPECFLCYRPPDGAPAVAPRPVGPITFGSFNSRFKVNGALIRTWAELLKRVPGSRLLLKAVSFQSEEMRASCYREFSMLGISRERIQCVSWEPDQHGHLALYNEVDIGLDTYPYHGTTTTCEALWMGVPVVTRSGSVHASRVGVSLLHQVGLDDLVAGNEEDYISRAVALARQPDRRIELRRTLRDRMAVSPLCNARTFTRYYEQAIRFMWRNVCRNGVWKSGEQQADRLSEPDFSHRSSSPLQIKTEPATSITADEANLPGLNRTVEVALAADALTRQGKRSEALVCALEGWMNIKMGRFQKDAPDELLQAWQSPDLGGVLLRQCLALSADSSYHNREHAREWMMAWAQREPSNPEPFLRLGLLLTLHAATTGEVVPPAALEALTHASNLMQDERSAKALALCSGQLAELSIPYGGHRIHLNPDVRDFSTYVLLEQGDWFEEELDLFRAVISPGMRVLDLAAGIGVYSLNAALRVGPRGQVVTTESDGYACKLIERTAEGFPMWAVKHVCVGEYGEDSKLDGKASVQNGIDGGEVVRGARAERVSIGDLAGEAGGEGFDVIRMGPEQDRRVIFKDRKRILREHASLVFLRIRDGTTIDWETIDRCREMGYETCSYVSGQQILAPINRQSEPDVLVANAIVATPKRIREVNQSLQSGNANT